MDITSEIKNLIHINEVKAAFVKSYLLLYGEEGAENFVKYLQNNKDKDEAKKIVEEIQKYFKQEQEQ